MTSRISFGRLRRDDFPLLTDWLDAPRVARWWGVRAVRDRVDATLVQRT